MKTIEAIDFFARVLKKSVEDYRHTGTVHTVLNCSQGSIHSIKISVENEREICIFERGPGPRQVEKILSEKPI